jgi:hypothetical protein
VLYRSGKCQLIRQHRLATCVGRHIFPRPALPELPVDKSTGQHGARVQNRDIWPSGSALLAGVPGGPGRPRFHQYSSAASASVQNEIYIPVQQQKISDP